MKRLLIFGPGLIVCAALGVVLLWVGASAPGPTGPDPEVQRIVNEASRAGLVAFGSEGELRGFLDELATARRKALRARHRHGFWLEPEEQEVAAAPEASTAGPGADTGGDESITNVQESGVDEGGIVKAWRDLLVVLRRGRLFTVRLGEAGMAPVASIDAFPPGHPHEAWYDEMLVADGTVVVVGYSYDLGGTELGLFDLGADGSLRYRATYFLRSNDYYSSRNYASRLIGRKLIFYMPYYPL